MPNAVFRMLVLITVVAALVSTANAQDTPPPVTDSTLAQIKFPDSVSIDIILDDYHGRFLSGRPDRFGCLVRVDSLTILFDEFEGSYLEERGIDFSDMDLVFVPGGKFRRPVAQARFDKIHFADATVCVAEPPSPKARWKHEKWREYLIVASEPVKIAEHVYSTGPIGTDKTAQGMFIETEHGIVLITGCALPGMSKIVRAAKKHLNRDVLLVVGGFHMDEMGNDFDEMVKEIEVLQGLGIKYVAPVHCTGTDAQALLKEAFAERFIDLGVGDKLNVSSLSAP